MPSKTALVNGEERPSSGKLSPVKRPSQSATPNVAEKVADSWNNFRHFLNDVRAEMRKVVTPSRKDVEATTTVVLIAVFLFGLFFFLTDSVFNYALHQLLGSLGGLQQ